MKDFIKWLGVNEKVAKVAVWLLIVMVFLIVFNTGLESLGFPYYKITYENIMKIDMARVTEIVLAALVSILNFYAVMLLIFRVKESKNLLKYSLIYYIGNILVNIIFGYGVLQIYIILFTMIFAYYYSGKKIKYLLYGLLSIIFNVFIQGIWYMTKVRFIDYDMINDATKSVLSIDYFIIIGIIILVKEIYLKKRGE